MLISRSASAEKPKISVVMPLYNKEKEVELGEKMGQRGHEVVEKKFSLMRFQEAILSAYAHFTGMHSPA
jgi:hypothetical protein